jgi:hypothetical protein
MAKLSVQNVEIRNMKELLKMYLLKKSGFKLSEIPSLSKETPSSTDQNNRGYPTSSSEND